MAGKIKVAMTGTGGDELFGNYGKWKAYFPFFKSYWTRFFKRFYTQGIKEVFSHYHGSLYHGYFGEKEKLHFTGLEPETVELSIKFHSSFCNPLEEVETLRKYLQSGESHILIVGDYVKGKFVIEGLREESGRTDKRGNPLQILVNLTLKEDVSDAQNQP